MNEGNDNTEKNKTPYEILRAIDVSEHVKKKDKFNYLTWSWALDILYQHDPDATFEYDEPVTYADGSMMVFCTVTAFGKAKKMHLPVLDYRNNAIKSPDAMAINKSMQRCLVKAIALHGLGMYIYAGEDLPEEEGKKQKKENDELFDKCVKIKEELSKCENEQQLKEYAEVQKVLFEEIKDKDENAYKSIRATYSAQLKKVKEGIK